MLDEANARFESEKELKNQKKINLEEENKHLSQQIESLLYVMKQEEFRTQTLKQKEGLLQKSMEDIMGFMSICDWTLQNDLSRSKNSLLRKGQSNIKGSYRARQFKDRQS